MLLVSAGTTMSTRDVENGYAAAFRELGVDLKLYALEARQPLALKWLLSQWRARGKDPEEHPTSSDVLYRSSVEALEMALRYEVDWVFAVSAMYFHPDAIELLRRAGVRVAVLFTESPYEDLPQLRVAQRVHWCWTNERTSVRTLRGGYLAPAYDPNKHYPSDQIDVDLPAHDVVFVGTGWIERIRLLEQIDWSGIDLGLYGHWELLGSRHRLRQYVRSTRAIENDSTIGLYRRAKVGLNLFRTSAGHRRKTWHYSQAESANPRTFELAACGLFQISQYRPEVAEIFGASVPTFTDAAALQSLLEESLNAPQQRADLARLAHEIVAPHTYAARAAQALADLESLGAAQAKGA